MKYYNENGEVLYSITMIKEQTGLSKNELTNSIRQLNLSPIKYNNSWLLPADIVLELMNYLLLSYQRKIIRLSR